MRYGRTTNIVCTSSMAIIKNAICYITNSMVTNILFGLVIKLFHSHYYTCSLSTKYVGCFFVVEDFAAVYNIIFKIIILFMPACVAPLYVLYVSVSNVAERASNTQTT